METTLDICADVGLQMLAAARPIARQYFRAPLTVERKSDHSPVTVADRTIETAMKAVLARQLPDHGILGEEHGATALDTGYVWVIDPIDGTKSFISGVPLFGTLIALLDHGQPIMGIMDMPMLGECWIGRKDRGTLLGRERCTTRQTTALKDAILFATSPDQFKSNDAGIFDAISRTCVERRFGGDCYSYGLLASGHVDLIVEADLQPYDFLPLVTIVSEAGGIISDWDGNALSLASDGRVVAAATAQLHAEALDHIAKTRRQNVA